MTTILYGGVNVFSGLAPTPYFSSKIDMLQAGERYGQVHNYSMRGQLTGQCKTFQQRVDRQKALLSGFSKDFQTFTIQDTGLAIINYPCVKITNISFDESRYGAIIPFQIDIEAYPSGYFGVYSGIAEPKETFDFSETSEGTISLTHTVSARGLNYSAGNNTALENAGSWVRARTGYRSQILPSFISGSAFTGCARTVASSIDRLNAIYEVRETYVSDAYGSAPGILRYSTDLTSGIDDGIVTIEVKGILQGCKNGNISGLRSRYASFNAVDEAIYQLSLIANRTDLNPYPSAKSVSEDGLSNRIQFSFSYNDDSRGRLLLSYEVSFDYSFEEDIVFGSVSAKITSKDIVENRWAQVLDFASHLDLYSLIAQPYQDYISANLPHLIGYPLLKRPISTSRAENQSANEISLSARFSNDIAPLPGLDAWDYSLAFSPATRQYTFGPLLDGAGGYYVTDLGFARRATLSLSANALKSESTSTGQFQSIIKNELLRLQNTYLTGSRKALESQSLSLENGSFSGVASVAAVYSASQPDFIF